MITYKMTLIVCGAALAGILAGTGVLSASAKDSEAGPPSASYAINEHGQKIGEYRIGEEKPDLIPATTDEGNPGFIYLDDIDWKPASTPEEAVRLTEERTDEAGNIIVPVYLEDGTTQIGTFTAGHVDVR